MEHNLTRIQDWIKKVVDSCETDFHFEGTQIIIDKFKEICEDENDWIEVQDYFNLKYNDVHAIIKVR